MATEYKEAESSDTKNVMECAVCYQECVHPVKLPCRHIFCYLCVKGAVTRTKRCALCRHVIPLSYLENPEIVDSSDLDIDQDTQAAEVQWFYQARRRGWWLYEKRIANELEERYQKNSEDTFDIQIAGFLYTIDFENMEQYRKDNRTISRAIKRDHIKHVEGVQGKAGLRLNSLNTGGNVRHIEGSMTGEENTTVSGSSPNITQSSRNRRTLPLDDRVVSNRDQNISTRTPQPRTNIHSNRSTRVVNSAAPVDISQLVEDMNLIGTNELSDSSEPETHV